MSQMAARGIDALTDEDWERMEKMAEEYDDEFGDLLSQMVKNHNEGASDE
ncbi:hypothetical protein [Halococcus hamelinensis]|nr:hypothetical protein [Halococcus hamelinensis]